MQRYHAILLGLCLCLATAAAAAGGTTLEVIELHHRPAKEVVPIIQPFLGPHDVVRGTGFQIILRTDTQRLAQIRKIIAHLDKAPKRLLITVRHTSVSLDGSSGAGGQVRTGKGGDTSRVRIYSTENQDQAAADQRIQVLEGHRAFIRTGQSIPLGEHSVTTGPGGTSIQDTIRYRNVMSGFYVVPRLDGHRVILHIIPQRAEVSRENGGKINVQRAETTLSGPVGQWLTVGGTIAPADRDATGIIYRTEDSSEQRGSVQVKVEVLK